MKFHIKFNKITRTELGARKPDWPKPSALKLGRYKFIKAYEQDLASSKLKDKILLLSKLEKKFAATEARRQVLPSRARNLGFRLSRNKI